MTERLLSVGLKYTATVKEIYPAADSFASTKGANAGGTIFCHFLDLEVVGFPDIHKVQWCNNNKDISEFGKGDDIKIIVSGTNIGKGMQTIKFEQVVKTKMQKVQTDLYKNTGVEKKDDFKDPGVKNNNPIIGGTLWSVCLGHAIQFHKDRKGSSIKDAMMDAVFLEEDYKKRFLND